MDISKTHEETEHPLEQSTKSLLVVPPSSSLSSMNSFKNIDKQPPGLETVESQSPPESPAPGSMEEDSPQQLLTPQEEEFEVVGVDNTPTEPEPETVDACTGYSPPNSGENTPQQPPTPPPEQGNEAEGVEAEGAGNDTTQDTRPGQELPAHENDIWEYESNEQRMTFKREQLLKVTREGHRCRRMSIKVKRKQQCEVFTLLDPAVSDPDGEQHVILQTTAVLSSKLVERLGRWGEDCSIKHEAEVFAGRRAIKKQVYRQPFTVGEGEVKFHHPLLSCEEVKNCRCERVAVIFRAALIISWREENGGFSQIQ